MSATTSPALAHRRRPYVVDHSAAKGETSVTARSRPLATTVPAATSASEPHAGRSARTASAVVPRWRDTTSTRTAVHVAAPRTWTVVRATASAGRAAALAWPVVATDAPIVTARSTRSPERARADDLSPGRRRPGSAITQVVTATSRTASAAPNGDITVLRQAAVSP